MNGFLLDVSQCDGVEATVDSYGGSDVAFNNAGIEGEMDAASEQTLSNSE